MYDYTEKKIVAVLAQDLESGVALNVLGHLAVSLGAYGDKTLMGRPYLTDHSGVSHRGIARYPFVITKEKRHRLRGILEKARQIPTLFVGDYPVAMLSTGHDDDLAHTLALQPEDDIEYLGLLLFGPTVAVSQLTGKLSLWR